MKTALLIIGIIFLVVVWAIMIAERLNKSSQTEEECCNRVDYDCFDF